MIVRRIDVDSLSGSIEGDRVVALGNYDGVHLGHQKILQEVVALAKATRKTPAVLTFYPHPRVFFSSDGSDRGILAPFRERLRIFSQLGIEEVLAFRFTEVLSKLSGREFLKILTESLKVKLLLVGQDACIGRGRELQVDKIGPIFRELGGELRVQSDVAVLGSKVSASQVRMAVQAGDTLKAYALLGRPYQLFGRVVRGDGRGAGIGVPTINLSRSRQLLPASGVYVTRVTAAGREIPAITNVGVRPTFNGADLRVETHLLNGPYPEMYGAKVALAFIERLRPERRFDTVNDLITAIRSDIAVAREKHGI